MTRLFMCDAPGCHASFRGSRQAARLDGWRLILGARLVPSHNHPRAIRELLYSFCPDHEVLGDDVTQEAIDAREQEGGK